MGNTRKTASLTRGSVVLTASRIVTVALAYGLNVYLARELGPELFGVLAVIITVLAWFELFVAEALPLWIVRVVDPGGDGPLIPRSYLLAQLGLSVALGTALFLVAPVLAGLFGIPDDAVLFRIAALDLPLFALFSLFQGVLLGSRAYVLQASADASYSLAKLVMTVAFVGSGLAVLGAILGSIAASVIGATLAFTLILVNFRGRTLVGESAEAATHTRGDALRGAAAPAVLVLTTSLALSADLWIVKAMLPAADAGYYRAAGLFAHVPITLASGIVWSLYSAYSAAHRQGDTDRMRHYVAQVTRLLITAGALWIAVIVPTSGALLGFVFAAEYAEGATVLALLATATGIGMLGIAMAPLLLIEGKSRGVLAGVLSLLGLEVVAAVVLTPQYGSNGTAFAVLVAHAAGTVWALSAMRWRLALPLGSLLARLLGPALLIGAAAWAIHPAANAWLVGWYAVFALAYVGLLFLTGGITRADIEAVREGLFA